MDHQADELVSLPMHAGALFARIGEERLRRLLWAFYAQVMADEGKLDPTTASMAKLWTTDMQCSVIDRCLQLFGGYGYMMEYPIARGYAAARVQKIYGGTNEIMKTIIAKELA